MRHLGPIAALIVSLALPVPALAGPVHPGWQQAAADLQAAWQKQHPGEKLSSIQKVPGMRFRGQSDWSEITYLFEVKVQKSAGEQLLRIGANYRSKRAAPYVFAGINEDLSTQDKMKDVTAVPLLDGKDARLVRALREGSLAAVQAALAAGANPQAKDDEDGLHALVWAARSGNVKIVKLLLDKGVGVNATTDETGVTALMAAVGAPGYIEVARFLLDKGAEVDARNVFGGTALMLAKDAKLTKLLLDRGAGVNLQDKQGQTALTHSDNLAIAKLLLAKGADVNAKNPGGETALLRAAAGGRLDMAKLLLDKGAQVDARDARGRTPLFAAVESGHTEMVGLLLARRADANGRDKAGQTVLMVAAKKGSLPLVKLLLDKGADVNARDLEGRTVLMSALPGGLAVVQSLVERGADVRAKDPQGRTAMNLGAEQFSASSEVIRYLGGKEAHGPAQVSPPPAGATAEPALSAQSCGDPCALLTRYAFDDLVANACKMCRKLDDTFCHADFPWNDVPACEAYDELRNCIYARFGYVFAKPRWRKQFGQLPWYKPDPAFTEAKLPAVAKANIKKLKALKAQRKGCQ